jgi:hypothetical protein
MTAKQQKTHELLETQHAIANQLTSLDTRLINLHMRMVCNRCANRKRGWHNTCIKPGACTMQSLPTSQA